MAWSDVMQKLPPEGMSGGCQCGAVRYQVANEIGDFGWCHCRMCQKAFGGPGAALLKVPRANLRWTRGKPSEFRSSAVVARGFCSGCGTPLYMVEDRDPHYELAAATLDQPARLPPVSHQNDPGSRLPWFDGYSALPSESTEETRTPEDLQHLRSLQHPDHDAAHWPPRD
jgi:hypothetical protein